jgi:hypothetical protein
MTLECAHCLLGGRDEAVESLLCLIYVFFCKHPYIVRNLEIFGGGHGYSPVLASMGHYR